MVDMLPILFIYIAILLLSLSVMANEENELPSPELLEFLGEWNTEEGEWFNPLWILKNLSSEKDTSNDEVSDDE